MLNSKISRAQQCQQLAVSCRLVLAHLSNCRWTTVPEVSQQRRDELAIQLLAMTRADGPAGAVDLRAAEFHALGHGALEPCFDSLADHRPLKLRHRLAGAVEGLSVCPSSGQGAPRVSTALLASSQSSRSRGGRGVSL